MTNNFWAKLKPEEREIFKKLNYPARIQDFLNSIPMNFGAKGHIYRSPKRVLKSKTVHCAEGAFFAAAVLWFHGHKLLLMDSEANNRN